MRQIAITVLSVLVFAAGCVPTRPNLSNSSATPASNSESQASESPDLSVAPNSASATPPTTENHAQAIQNSSAAAKAAEDKAHRADATKKESLAAKGSVKPATTNKPTLQVESKAATSVAAIKTPPLDLTSLQLRLRETHAIGVFTKLSLKNQVDDLLGEFRDFYAGKIKMPLAQLRERYDLLVIKVLTLLQDSDAALASAISSSREAIWSILADPKKFTQIS